MKELARNRRAYSDYTISETLEAGLVLSGAEVKSAKYGGVNLSGSYARIIGGELFLINGHIKAYTHASPLLPYDPTRSRKLLAHKHELTRLSGKIEEKGLTLIPLSAYNKKGRIKILIGLGKAKKKYDKRETIKKREAQRSIQRAVRNASRTTRGPSSK